MATTEVRVPVHTTTNTIEQRLDALENQFKSFQETVQEQFKTFQETLDQLKSDVRAEIRAQREQNERELNLPSSFLNDKACPVCMEDMQPGTLLRTMCWHVYHFDCLQTLRTYPNSTCATCRSPLTKCYRIRVLDDRGAAGGDTCAKGHAYA